MILQFAKSIPAGTQILQLAEKSLNKEKPGAKRLDKLTGKPEQIIINPSE